MRRLNWSWPLFSVFALAQLSLCVGWWRAAAGARFLWFTDNPGDSLFYLGLITRGGREGLAISNPWNAADGARAIVQPFWTSVGVLLNALGGHSTFGLELARLVSSAVLIGGACTYLHRRLADPRARTAAAFVASFVGGAGALARPFGQRWPDAFDAVFSMHGLLSGVSHHAFALGLACFVGAELLGRRRPWLLAPLAFAAGAVHPTAALLLTGAAAGQTLRGPDRMRAWIPALAAGIGAAAIALPLASSSSWSVYLSASRGLRVSYPWWVFLGSAAGILLVCARAVRLGQFSPTGFEAGWCAVALIAPLTPLPLGTHAFLGATFFLACASASSLLGVFERARPRSRAVAIGFLVAFTAPTLLRLSKDWLAAQPWWASGGSVRVVSRDAPFYVDRELAGALGCVAAQLRPGDLLGGDPVVTELLVATSGATTVNPNPAVRGPGPAVEPTLRITREAGGDCGTIRTLRERPTLAEPAGG